MNVKEKICPIFDKKFNKNTKKKKKEKPPILIDL